MNKKFLFILISSVFLFQYASSIKRSFYYRNKKYDREKKKYPLLTAFSSGDKRYLSKEQKKSLQVLAMYHILTPSGLHLTSFFFLLSPLLLKIKRKTSLIKNIIELSILLFIIFYFTQYFSLIRMAMYKLLRKILSSRKINNFVIFLLTFSLDFIFGNFNLSPFSFCYSYLFFGTIISSINGLGISQHLMTHIYIAQMFISIYANGYLYLIGPFLGFLLTSIFVLFFPIWLLSYFILPYFEVPFLFLSLTYFKKSILFFSQMSTSFFVITPHLGHIFFLLLWTSHYKKCACFILLITPHIIHDAPMK